MAHVGKFYPVHFRRDLGIDLNDNRAGYAKRYDVRMGSCSGTVGNVLDHLFLRCNPIDEKTFNGAKWQSSFIPAAGHLIRYTIEASSAVDYPRNSLRLTVEDQLLGMLAQFNAVRVVGRALNNVSGLELYAGPTHPELFNRAGVSWGFEAIAVGW
jgi:hypothetical protein